MNPLADRTKDKQEGACDKDSVRDGAVVNVMKETFLL
jgi:hypothetical protein